MTKFQEKVLKILPNLRTSRTSMVQVRVVEDSRGIFVDIRTRIIPPAGDGESWIWTRKGIRLTLEEYNKLCSYHVEIEDSAKC